MSTRSLTPTHKVNTLDVQSTLTQSSSSALTHSLPLTKNILEVQSTHTPLHRPSLTHSLLLTNCFTCYLKWPHRLQIRCARVITKSAFLQASLEQDSQHLGAPESTDRYVCRLLERSCSGQLSDQKNRPRRQQGGSPPVILLFRIRKTSDVQIASLWHTSNRDWKLETRNRDSKLWREIWDSKLRCLV